MNRPSLLPTLMAAATPVAAAFPVPAPPTPAFTGATVWDGTGTPAHRADILVRDGRIVAVGSPEIPADAVVHDVAGKWIIPGLVEAHAHVSGYWADDQITSPRLRAEEELALYARYGVTTVNSLGGEPLEAFALRQEGGGTVRPRARVHVAGPVVTATTPEAVAEALTLNASLGVDWMKIRVDDNLGTTEKLPWEAIQAIADGSHERGLRLATHLFYLDDAKRLLRMGSDLIAHSIRDADVDAEVIGLFRETGVCYVPTLTREISTFVYGQRPDFFDDPFFVDGAKASEVARVSEPAFMAQMSGSFAAARYREALVQAQSNLKVLVDAGIPVAFGTDAGPPGRFPGYFEHLELALMVEAGLTPEEALVSATRVAATCLGLHDVGTLEAGKWADLLVLEADPLADIAATRALEQVFVAGNRVR